MPMTWLAVSHPITEWAWLANLKSAKLMNKPGVMDEQPLTNDLVAPRGRCRYLKMSLIFWKKRPTFHSQQVKGELEKKIYSCVTLSIKFCSPQKWWRTVWFCEFKKKKNNNYSLSGKSQGYLKKIVEIYLIMIKQILSVWAKGRKLHGNIPNVHNVNSKFNKLKSLHRAQQKAELVGKDQTWQTVGGEKTRDTKSFQHKASSGSSALGDWPLIHITLNKPANI